MGRRILPAAKDIQLSCDGHQGISELRFAKCLAFFECRLLLEVLLTVDLPEHLYRKS